MIAGLLAGAAQAGLVGLVLRRLVVRWAIGLGVVLLSLGAVLLAIGFVGLAAFLALDGLLPPFGAALVVATGMLALAALGGLGAWLYLRRGSLRTVVGGAAPLGAPAVNPIYLALAALGAGLATGNALFRRR